MHPPNMPMLQNVACQPTSSSRKPMKGARIAVPTPPRGPEYAGPHAQAPPEPPAYRGHQRHHGDALRDGQHAPVHDEELPQVGNEPQQHHARTVEDAARKHHAARAIAVSQPSAYRGAQGAHQVVGCNTGADGADAPAKISTWVGQRRQQNPGSHAYGGGEDLDNGQDGDDNPAIMKAPRQPYGSQPQRVFPQPPVDFGNDCQGYEEYAGGEYRHPGKGHGRASLACDIRLEYPSLKVVRPPSPIFPAKAGILAGGGPGVS